MIKFYHILIFSWVFSSISSAAVLDGALIKQYFQSAQSLITDVDPENPSNAAIEEAFEQTFNLDSSKDSYVRDFLVHLYKTKYILGGVRNGWRFTGISDISAEELEVFFESHFKHVIESYMYFQSRGSGFETAEVTNEKLNGLQKELGISDSDYVSFEGVDHDYDRYTKLKKPLAQRFLQTLNARIWDRVLESVQNP